jgi:hypothetical protein
LDYLGGPRKEFFFDNFFSIGQGPSNVGKLNWNLLVFFSFIFSLGQCDMEVLTTIDLQPTTYLLLLIPKSEF